jgi:hypothetical protein
MGLLLSLVTARPYHLPAQASNPVPAGAGSAFSGIAGQTRVPLPRLAAQPDIDGALNEPAWSQAALLTGFSQYQPVDGRPADDSTEVLVWYSPKAIYFGIRAFEAHGAVHATLANRDKIGSDDYIQILLDTFDDHRRALVFGVNPLGVQSDGTITEGSQTVASGAGGVLGPSNGATRDTADLSADFAYQSRGRLTDYGYEVEIRIPFKSIRLQASRSQDWGVNVVRRVQHSSYEDTWTAARRANASFLGQSGTLTGLQGLERGLVLDVNPVITSKVTGVPGPTGWQYDAQHPEAGGNVRLGLTNNLTLNGTVRPDFSQVEADVQQVVVEPRAALFYPEKRPFFLEGIEQFDTPNRLIYSRRVVQPVTATKLTGKALGTTIGLLSAIDDRDQSASGTNNPIYNMVRLRRDLGGQSVLGMVYTDKMDDGDFNRVAGVDTRIVFRSLYAFAFQAAGSFTRTSGARTSGPMFDGSLERRGRGLGLRFQLRGFHPDFHTASGFLSRGNIVSASLTSRFTLYGKPGALMESAVLSVPLSADWKYRNFWSAGPAGDLKNDNSLSLTLRGGWRLGAILFPESFKYDPDLYAGYAIQQRVGTTVDTIPFTGTDRLTNWDLGVNAQTPAWAKLNGYLSVLSGQDENFYEWSSAWIWLINAVADFRPTDQVRIEAQYTGQRYLRLSDGTMVGTRDIPRLKVEYQLSRPIFLRLVAQYDIQWRDSLRDDSRTGFPLLLKDAGGVYRLTTPAQSNALRVDWLFSYQPNPGTVFFAGYGSNLTETDAFAFRDLRRTADGFFVKLSYLFQL